MSISITLAGHSGLTIAASIEGPDDGMPVILAHGGGQTRRAWKHLMPSLGAHGFKAIALDLRGHGDSAWAIDGCYDIFDFAMDVGTIGAATHPKPAFVGASLGGLAGMVAEGALASGTFASLTMVDITPKMEAGGIARIIGFMAAHASSGFASPDEAARIISEYLPHRPSGTRSSGLIHYLRLKADGRYYWHWDPAFIDGIMRRRTNRGEPSGKESCELDNAATRLHLPVHLIRGGSSDLVSPEAVTHFRKLVPHAEYTDMVGVTHMVVGDHNDAFCAAIIDFLLRVHGKGAS
jgi:pimeloyl-ACP methyl ester carboxylesterase